MNPEILRKEILEKVREYSRMAFSAKPLKPGQTAIPVSGRVFDEEELVHLVDSSLDFWLTTGRFAEQFEKELARYINIKHALVTNSGSSANLLLIPAPMNALFQQTLLRYWDIIYNRVKQNR